MTDQSFLYGISPVQQCLLHNSRNCKELLVKANSKAPRVKEILTLARQRKVPVKECDPNQLGRLAGTKLHQGVVLKCGELNRYSLDQFLTSDAFGERSLIVAVDQVEDPQNLGAIIRSAAFLGASALLTLRKHSAPLTATVSKASAGALEYFPIIEETNLSESLQRLKREGFSIAGAMLGEQSVPLRELPRTDYMTLVLGNEGQGLRKLTQKRCDYLTYIPGNEETESLNVSAAAAILIHHLVN